MGPFDSVNFETLIFFSCFLHECIFLSAHINQGLNRECLVYQIFVLFKFCQCVHTVNCYGCRKLIDIILLPIHPKIGGYEIE